MLFPFKAACGADLLIDLIGLSILICQMKSSSVLNCADEESTKGTQWQFTQEVILSFVLPLTTCVAISRRRGVKIFYKMVTWCFGNTEGNKEIIALPVF